MRSAGSAAGGETDAPFSAKEAHLLRSTYQVLGREGMERLALQTVADEAGVSKGTLLYYFGTKQNLVLQTMRWVSDRVARRARLAVSQAATAEVKLTAMIDAIAVDAEANRRFYLTFSDLLVYEARQVQPEPSGISASFYSVCEAMFAEIVALGAAEGAFRVADVAEAASVVRALMDGLFIQWLAEPDWQRRHGEFVARCERAALAYLRSGG